MVPMDEELIIGSIVKALRAWSGQVAHFLPFIFTNRYPEL
jgi:hypothetical protein